MNLLGHRGIHSTTDVRSEFRAAWDRVEIHAQPLHDTTDGAVHVVEALTRWRRSAGELWAPGLVMPLAKELGLAEACASWATELALASWSGSSYRECGSRLELNIEPGQLASEDFVDTTTALIRRVGVEPRELILTIPDRMGSDSCRRAVRCLEPLTAAGAAIAIDDHQGRASATSLDASWLPFGSIVKLDQALTIHADSEPAAEILMSTVFSLHLDGYQVVAKSLDTLEQLTSVISAGVDLVQGSLFSLPTPLT